ncbi:MAG: glycosyltransferase family 39 protein [Solobacterium sp.]|nr:glycosyltransferase family 39 protein [Solobacterium sp.]
MNLFLYPQVYVLLITGTVLYLFSHSKINERIQWSNRTTALFLFGMALLFSCVRIVDGLGWDGDCAQFIAQTKALVTGTLPEWLKLSEFTYRYTTLKGLGTVVYPWGESLLLAPLYALFGKNLIAFKILGALFFSASVVVLYFILLEMTDQKNARFISLFCAINTGMLIYINDVLSDYPYLFFSFLAIWFVFKYVKNKRPFSYAIGIGVCAFCAVICRSLGFALLVALGLIDLAYGFSVLTKKEYKDGKDLRKKVFVAFTPYMVFVLLDVVLNQLLPSGGGYGSLFLIDFKNMAWLFSRYLIVFTDFFGNFNSGFEVMKALLYVFVGIVLLLSLIGMIHLLNQQLPRYIVFYLFITVCVLLLFDGFQGSRYLLAVMPFVLYFALQEVQHYPKLSPYFVGILGGLLLVMGLYNCIYAYSVHTGKEKINYMYDERSIELYDYVKTLDEEASIYFMRPRILSLETDRPCFGGEIETAETIFAQADYVVLYKDRFDYKEFYPLCEAKGYSVVFSNSWFDVFEVAK